jgi:hypothetical protein
MDLGEQFTALENHIFAFAKSQFERNGIPPTLARIIMEAVYSRFQDKAIEQMIVNQIKVEDNEPKDDEKITQSEESIQETVNALKNFYGKETEKDGGTENSSAQA